MPSAIFHRLLICAVMGASCSPSGVIAASQMHRAYDDRCTISGKGGDSIRVLLGTTLISPSSDNALDNALMAVTIGGAYEYRLDSTAALSAEVFTGFVFNGRFGNQSFTHVTSSPPLLGIGVSYRKYTPIQLFSGWYMEAKYVHAGRGKYGERDVQWMSVPDFAELTIGGIAHVSSRTELTVGLSYIIARRNYSYFGFTTPTEWYSEYAISIAIGFGF